MVARIAKMKNNTICTDILTKDTSQEGFFSQGFPLETKKTPKVVSNSWGSSYGNVWIYAFCLLSGGGGRPIPRIGSAPLPVLQIATAIA